MSVTAVPIRPLAKGSVAMLWLGIVALCLVAVGLAWLTTGGRGYTTTASGLQYRVIQPGEGPSPTDSDIALIRYTGRLQDGTVFDSNADGQPLPLPVGPGGSIAGFSEGMKLMQKGGRYELRIPGDLAYGPRGVPGTIPPNATLDFEVELLDFISQAALQGMGLPGQ